MRFAAVTLFMLSMIVGCSIRTPINPHTEFSPAAPKPPSGLSDSGIDYGNWVGGTEYEYAPEDHPFRESVFASRLSHGDGALIAALRSDGFECSQLIPAADPPMWRCTHQFVEDAPMSHRWITRWSVDFWGQELFTQHSGGVVLWY